MGDEHIEGPWEPIATAPRDGSRHRVGHQFDPSSMKPDAKYFITTGVFDNGEWVCTAGFVCTDGMFRFEPTHWLPSTEGAEVTTVPTHTTEASA